MRYFSGEDADWREYKRWKQWASNRMLTMDKLAKTARGPFIWTLLQGKALEVVEHLKPEDYQVEGGEDVLFKLLDSRWPEIDKPAEMGEVLTKVFGLKASPGENLREWSARAADCFDSCNRKSGIKFPEEAKGYILLNCSGLSAEQRGVILARAQGSLKFETISQSMRSCFPDLVIPKGRTAGVSVVDDVQTQHAPQEEDATDFQDVEVFLSQYGLNPENDEPGDPTDAFEEDEVAEVLASTWKERRQELSKLQKGRRFQQASDVKKTFRVEVEELKRRTRCRKCGRIGHWQKECTFKAATQPSGSAGSGKGSSKGSGASYVETQQDEHFICMAIPMIEELYLRRELSNEVCLVSSPGFAVLDSGCGKTIIGSETLEMFKEILIKKNIDVPPEQEVVNFFKFGNGETEESRRSIYLPVCIAGNRGRIQAAIVRGKAPLLMSRVALKKLRAEMNFGEDQMTLFQERVQVPLTVNAAGQYAIDVSDFGSFASSSSATAETDPVVNDEPGQPEAEPIAEVVTINKQKGSKKKDFWEVKPKERLVIRHHVKSRTARFTPCHSQCPVPIDALESFRCSQIEDSDAQTSQVCDNWCDPTVAHATIGSKPWTGTTVFQLKATYDIPDTLAHCKEPMMSQLSEKHHRQLLSQMEAEVLSVSAKQNSWNVVEVFSPPRFALAGASQGLRCLSADLVTGWDFRKSEDRKRMRSVVEQEGTDLLVLCPPCTWAGGWFHLNKQHMTPEEVREREVLTKLFVNFCCSLIEIQLSRGGRIMFEHPKGSCAWHFPAIEKLMNKMWIVDLHMCCYDMKIPGELLIRKPTRLLVSHKNMSALSRKCPGATNPRHRCHQPIAGHHPKVGSVSKHAGAYPKAFVHAVLKTEPKFNIKPILAVTTDTSAECLAAARLQDVDDQQIDQVKASLKRLHVNLGHPSNNHLVRILKHGGASETALKCARDFSCDLCRANSAPKPALPAQVHRTTEFNALVGLDVKFLTGWKINQKIPAVNMVDYASGFQMMVPLFAKETSESIKRCFQERWISWAGVPQEVVVDPAKTMISEALTTAFEQIGITIKITAAEAHWQLGKTEVHGGWFNKVLEKVIQECAPTSQDEWIACVNASHCKNQLIQVYGMTPAQFVFGRNPRIPENLLDEPLAVVPATTSLYNQQIARQIEIRQTARRSLIELQDDRALRRALAARPRVQPVFRPGMYVAYWRSQKWKQGTLDHHGQWYGPALVLGTVGRNLVIVHKRQILRCAPEQMRPSTQDELQLVETPDMDLLGIKNLIETGQLNSRQYVDLVPESYPAAGDNAPVAPAAALDEPEAPKAVLGQVGQSELPDAAMSPEIPDEELYSPGTPLPDDVKIEEAHGNSSLEPENSEYGPIRRRVTGKSDGHALYRPAKMAEEDFADVMKEVVPHLIEQAMQSDISPGVASSSSASQSHKRSASQDGNQNPPKVPRSEEHDETLYVLGTPEGTTYAMDEVEVLSVVPCSIPQNDRLSNNEIQELNELWKKGVTKEVLIANYMQKKASKEVKGTGNPVEIQKKIDEAKVLEWNTILAKNAARLVLGPEAVDVRHRLGHRIMGSRYVVTVKQEDDAPARMKARWCLQGHLDPDLHVKALKGDLQSPTLSQIGRNLLFQLIASHKWSLKLGDIKGAFLSAGELPKQYRPLYASLPAGGIPGVPEDALIEITGHVSWSQRFTFCLVS